MKSIHLEQLASSLSPKQQTMEHIRLVCSKTGIQSWLIAPSLPRKHLEYQHPLADSEAAQQIIDEGINYLRRLDKNILAGVLLTILGRYHLVAGQNTAASKNAMLMGVPSEALIQCLHVCRGLKEQKDRLGLIPSLSLDSTSYGEQKAVNYAVLNFTREVRDILYPPFIPTTLEEVKIENRYQQKLIKHQLAIQKAAAKDFKEYYKAARQEAKARLADLLIDPKLKHILYSIFSKDNLITMSATLRDKIILKCQATQGLEWVAIQIEEVLDRSPDVDIFSTPESMLERASDNFSSPRKRTLTEILAAKQQKKAEVPNDF